MSAKVRVAVLFGGRSAEHEISLLSARFVARSLDPERFETVLVGIDKEGRFRLADAAFLLEAERDPRLVKLHQAAAEVRFELAAAGEHALVVEGARGARGVDVVFPVLHGPMGEDGTIQGMLELLGLPYVGAGVLGSAVGMDKDVMKRLLAEAELPIVRHATLRKHLFEAAPGAELSRVAERLDGAQTVFVKPANLGSSVGISRVRSPEALEPAVREAFLYDEKVLVEEGVPGARELECAVLGDLEPEPSVVGEIVVDHPDGFYSYDAKYVDEVGATLRIPAELSADQVRAIQLLAIRTFRVLEASGLARVDFFLSRETGELYVNEINSIPGFTSISMYPKLWEASGVPARALVGRLVDLALARAARRRSLRMTK